VQGKIREMASKIPAVLKPSGIAGNNSLFDMLKGESEEQRQKKENLLNIKLHLLGLVQHLGGELENKTIEDALTFLLIKRAQNSQVTRNQKLIVREWYLELAHAGEAGKTETRNQLMKLLAFFNKKNEDNHHLQGMKWALCSWERNYQDSK